MRKLILLTLLLSSQAYAEKLTIIYKQKCSEIELTEYTTNCFNDTQAASRAETEQQVLRAIKNTGYNKKLKIISIDPLRPERGRWVFGAWIKNGKIYFSAEPGCPNARVELARLLRRLK